MQSDKSDIDIIKGMREGKVSAFRDLYTRYSNLIYRNILVRVNSVSYTHLTLPTN